MKIRTSELIDEKLDWAVAVCENRSGRTYMRDGKLYEPLCEEFLCYSTNWAKAGEIIDREIDSLRKRSEAEELSLAYPNPNFKFKAEIFTDDDYFCGFGSTPLIAAMRCYVTSKLGDIVDIPEELI